MSMQTIERPTAVRPQHCHARGAMSVGGGGNERGASAAPLRLTGGITGAAAAVSPWLGMGRLGKWLFHLPAAACESRAQSERSSRWNTRT
jgi:hypothetical protein